MTTAVASHRTSFWRRSLLLVVATTLISAYISAGTASAATSARGRVVRADVALTQLTTWWHGSRGDNFASGTEAGDKSARDTGYTSVRHEGWIPTTPVAGTRPLYTYWHGTRGDNFAASHPSSISAANVTGYSLIRVEGYVYTTPVPGTVPLYTYWHGGRADNFSAASLNSIEAAGSTGYSVIRIEGYIFPY
jgi:hypothetical protein